MWEKNLKKSICICISDSLWYTAETQHCKSAILQNILKRKRTDQRPRTCFRAREKGWPGEPYPESTLTQNLLLTPRSLSSLQPDTKGQWTLWCRPVKPTVVRSLGHVWLFETLWTSLFFTISQSLCKLMSIKSVMPCNHLILCHPLLLLPPIPPSSRVFSSESALHIRWPKYWSFSFSISPSSVYLGLISFRVDSSDLLAVQRTLTSLLQHHSLKAPILWYSAFFMVSHIRTWVLEKPELWLYGPLLAE